MTFEQSVDLFKQIMNVMFPVISSREVIFKSNNTEAYNVAMGRREIGKKTISFQLVNHTCTISIDQWFYKLSLSEDKVQKDNSNLAYGMGMFAPE